MEIYYQPELANSINFLSEEESKHCIRVLRHKVGDKISIVDGNGLRVEAEITDPKPKKCEFKVLKEVHAVKKAYEINIAIAPTKNQDRIEWFIEKAVEIGVDKIDYVQHININNSQLQKKNNKNKKKYKIFIAYYLKKVRLIDNI